MNKHFVLIIEYLTGTCAFLTDKSDIQEALNEFLELQSNQYNSADKSCMMPQVISAKIVRLYYDNKKKEAINEK